MIPADPIVVAARRALLDAFEALAEHEDAVVLVGAQAIYLRTESPGFLETLQPFTTDADLILQPERLADAPAIGDAMRSAGFELRGRGEGVEPGVWVRHDDSIDAEVPVDLIVPEGFAPAAGRRGARLGEPHGRSAAHKARGLEPAFADNDLMEVGALDEADPRRVSIRCAGPAALLVSKLHKIADRVKDGRRLKDKDAADVYRLLAANRVDELAARLRWLTEQGAPVAEVARAALPLLSELFAQRQAPGVSMAIRAMTPSVPAETVGSFLEGYVSRLLGATGA